jgi:hypothetical protein
MRTLDATLLAAMDSQNYDPYFLATIRDNYTGNVLLSGMPTGYELSDLELTLTVQMPAFLDVPFYRTSVVLTRGILVLGTPYTLSTSKFVIISSTWDGNFQTFNCHLIPRSHYSAPGDLTYSQVITDFCATFGKTAVFLDPAAAWLGWQFLPAGKTLTLNNAQQFFTTLRQKYFIFACDNGDDEILFYTAFTHTDNPQYTVQGYHFAVDYNVDQRRQYLWRDENETVHQTAPSFLYAAQPDAAVQAILSLLDLGAGTVLAGGYQPNHGYIYRSLDYGLTWDAGYDTGHSGVYSLVSLGNGVVLAAGSYGGFIQRSADNGLTWVEVLAIGYDTTCCLTDCGNGVVLCGHISPAGSPGCQVYKSVDYGLTWTLMQALGAETGLDAIVYLGGGICLAGTRPNGRVYRSTDYGSTWNLVQQLGTENGVYALLALGSGIVLAGTNPGAKIYKSSDAGVTWALVKDTPEQTVYTLNTLGSGVVLAGTGPGCQIWRSVDYGETWSLLQALGTESSVRSFITLGNGATLAGTGEHAQIHKSLNCAADLDVIHNLGFLPSTAVEPSAYFQLAQPKFDPFPVHLKYQSSDYIRIRLPSGNLYDFTCAQVTESLDLTKKAMPWRMLITATQWLSNTAGGPLPSTIERVAAYTPLVTANFNKNLDAGVNNLQAFADFVDDMDLGGGAGKASAAEVAAGTDDAKFVTALAIKDSHNVPSVAPGASGNVLTSDGTDWGSQAPAAGGYTQGARCTNSVAETTTNGTGLNLTFNTEQWDTDTIHDLVTNPDRFTCHTAGIYMLTFGAEFAANATGVRQIQIMKNGTAVATQNMQNIGAGAAAIMTVSAILSLAVNDYLQFRAYQNSGGNLNIVSDGIFSPAAAMQRIA